MQSISNSDVHVKFVFFKEKIAYAVGDTASVLYYQTFAMFLMIFYTDTFGISPAAVGTMFLISRIWDAVNDPMMGMIADRTETKWGKFRPWILWSIIPFVITGILVFITPDFSETGKLVYAYVTYTLVMMTYTMINVPYGALLGVISPHSQERTVLSSYRFLGAFTGNMIVQGTLLWLVASLGQGNDRLGYPLAFSVYALIAAGLFFFTFSATKERVKPPQEKTSIINDLKDLLKNGPWIVLGIMCLFTLIYISIRSASLLYFFKYYINDQSAAATFMVVGTVFSIIGAYATPWVVGIIKSKKLTFAFLTFMSALSYIVFYFVSPRDIAIMYTSHIIGSFFGGVLFPLIWSMYADTADYTEWKMGRRATGLVFSAATFSQKFGWAIGGSVAGFVLSAYGFVANAVQTDTSLLGIRHMMSTFPAAICIIVILFSLLYSLDSKTEKQMEIELLERKKAYNQPE
ncbi:MAG: MFS transporter [Deferribacteres bacterium]|nr:MFS transporter [Deferribacteres bacterium]